MVCKKIGNECTLHNVPFYTTARPAWPGLDAATAAAVFLLDYLASTSICSSYSLFIFLQQLFTVYLLEVDNNSVGHYVLLSFEYDIFLKDHYCGFQFSISKQKILEIVLFVELIIYLYYHFIYTREKDDYKYCPQCPCNEIPEEIHSYQNWVQKNIFIRKRNNKFTMLHQGQHRQIPANP